MQQLRNATKSTVSPGDCARDLLAGVPSVMRFIRHQMRNHRRAELSVPQFRALIFLHLKEDASLSAMAEHVGISLPAASRMVELLVKRGLMQRQTRRNDRRCVCLSLTKRGEAAFRNALQATQTAMAQQFKSLSLHELRLVSEAMQILGDVFDKDHGMTEPAK